MSFIDKLNNPRELFEVEAYSDEVRESKYRDFKEAADHLRALGYKIQLETKTRFGVQLDLAKSYPERELKRDLKEFDFDIEDNVVFVKR